MLKDIIRFCCVFLLLLSFSCIKTEDIVEIIGGPFKGEKGRVVRYDKVKREITIELLEVAVPIPVTVSVEFVKLLEKAKK